MRKAVLAVLVFSILYILVWVYMLSIRVEAGFHLKVPLMLIDPILVPFMVCFILSLWVLAFRKTVAPPGVRLIAALCILAGYSALAPALEISPISNILLLALGICLLLTAFGVITMKKRWFYITMALSALSIVVFSSVPVFVFYLFPTPIVIPPWLIGVSSWFIEIPVISYLIWKRELFLKTKGSFRGDTARSKPIT